MSCIHPNIKTKVCKNVMSSTNLPSMSHPLSSRAQPDDTGGGLLGFLPGEFDILAESARLDFVAAFERLANLATKAGVEGDPFTIHAPLQDMTKAEIAREAARLGLDAGQSHSCYDPGADGGACGTCDACRLRAMGFEQAGLPDPTRYAAAP